MNNFNERHDKLIEFLRLSGLEINDFNVMTTIAYDHCAIPDLIERTVNSSRESDARGLYPYSTTEDCSKAIDKLLEMSVLNLTNVEFVKVVAKHLLEAPAKGPYSGLPDH